ncbi:MAG: DUF4320 family protein [Oscillospiraceae bacterium]
MKAIFKSNKGTVLIEFLVGFFCIMLCLAFALEVLPVFSTKAKLDGAADKILRSAEMSGTTDVPMKIDELKAEIGQNFSVEWNGTTYIRNSQKVQLGGNIHLKLSTTYRLKFWKFTSIPIPITVRCIGTGERYHK